LNSSSVDWHEERVSFRDIEDQENLKTPSLECSLVTVAQCSFAEKPESFSDSEESEMLAFDKPRE
jgi:hypothetical protein